MAAFLTQIGTFFTTVIAWMAGGTVGETTYTGVLNVVMANPALLVLVIAMPIVGFAVGLLGRLIRL